MQLDRTDQKWSRFWFNSNRQKGMSGIGYQVLDIHSGLPNAQFVHYTHLDTKP